MKFKAKISKMGPQYIINIPKALEYEFKDLLGKLLIVEISEAKANKEKV